jgi:hypothetical protein
MDTNDDNHEPLIPEDACITCPEEQAVRLLGSHSSRLPLRRPPSWNPEPEPGIPPFPEPPPVSTPDLALQFMPCLNNLPSPPNTDLEAGLIEAIKEAFGANADVRYQCLSGDKGTIAIWLRPATSSSDDEARNRGLARIDILRTRENYAFFVNATLIRRSARETWDSTPKRLNENGGADANGSVHLTGMSISLRSPNQIITTIQGFDERPWPDVGFQLTTTDTLSVSGGEIRCHSNKDLDVDTSWLNFLTGLFLFVLPTLGRILVIEGIMVASTDTPNRESGVGCSVAHLIPGEILIPGGFKISAFYRRLNVSNGGVFAGGEIEPALRTPSVSLQGNSQFSVEIGTSAATGIYNFTHDDLLNPLRPVWTADGDVISPRGEQCTIRFNIGAARIGQVLTKRVHVRVTDRDGLDAEDELIVRIHVIASDPEIPIYCRKRPWLPNCLPK